jgi:serine/threonine protein kinase
MSEAERYQHYEIQKREDGSLWELGRSPVGVTYKAYDTNLRRPVALEIIYLAGLESEPVLQQFLRHGRALARLRHPNIASLYGVGAGDHGQVYCAMELIDGEPVDLAVKRLGRFKPAEALDIALQVSKALTAAAERKLIHCDLKPSNLMLVHERGEKVVKVIYHFPVAMLAVAEAGDSGPPAIAGWVGSPHFTSPEQIGQENINIRSDIYSLGATLYYMLTGVPPFTGSPAKVLSEQLYKSVPLEPLEGVPSQVVSLIREMMEKDPDRRPQNTAELQQRILNCLRRLLA